MDLIAYAVPFFLIAILAEWGFGVLRARDTYRLNDAFSSLMLGILSQARKFIVLGVGGGVYLWVTDVTDIPLWDSGRWYTWVFAFVLYDLCYYWLHRMGHERQILWAAHVAHHQSEDYNLSTALRQTSTGFLLGWLFYFPMYLIGIPAEVVVTVGALNLIYQFWVHTQHVPELGWFEYVFVSPSNHRVHHAQNDCYLDKNYGGVFIIWDRFFGTYARERRDEPCIYGIRGPIRSWNPVIALTHIYSDMARDILRTRRWRDRFRVLIARTGWQPEDVRERWPRNKSDLNDFERFDPQISKYRKGYAAVQLIAATALLAFGQFSPLEPLGYWLCWLLLVWTGAGTAQWLSSTGVGACLWVDVPRFAVLAAVLVTQSLPLGWVFAGGLWIGLSALLMGLEVLFNPVQASREATMEPLSSR